MRSLRCAACLWLLVAAAPALACIGDCDADGQVTVDEIVLGVSIALGNTGLDGCVALDRDGSGGVTVDELLAAITHALTGCPTPTETPTETPSASPTASATPTPNLPPQLPTPFVYRGVTGQPISFFLGAIDPEGGALSYSAFDLPAGAMLDPETGEFSWIPQAEELGAFYAPWQASDAGVPPLTSEGRLTFSIAAPDGCNELSCDTARGCTSALPPVAETCCRASGEAIRLAEPGAGCPEGLSFELGANQEFGFGALRNCDSVRLFQNGQRADDIQLRFHIAARCVNVNNNLTVRTRLDVQRPDHGFTVLIDEMRGNVRTELQPDGSVLARGVRFPFVTSLPDNFFDIEGLEGNLYVEVRDAEARFLSKSVRVLLTFTPIPDLPDPSPVPTPTPRM